MIAEWLGTFVAGVFVVLSLTLIGPSAAEETQSGALGAQIRGIRSTQGNANASPAASPSGETTVIDAPEVKIESEVPSSEGPLEQRAQQFRDALRRPTGSAVRERQLGNGVVEITTRFGRFCARSLPLKSQGGPGGDTTLVVPCVPF